MIMVASYMHRLYTMPYLSVTDERTDEPIDKNILGVGSASSTGAGHVLASSRSRFYVPSCSKLTGKFQLSAFPKQAGKFQVQILCPNLFQADWQVPASSLFQAGWQVPGPDSMSQLVPS